MSKQPKIKLYEVTLCRMVEQIVTVQVTALSEEEAIEVAWDDEHDWRTLPRLESSATAQKIRDII